MSIQREALEAIRIALQNGLNFAQDDLQSMKVSFGRGAQVNEARKLVKQAEAGIAALAALSAPTEQVPATIDVDALTEKIADMLHGTWHCTRVWEAWQVGTMGADDFEPVPESDTPREIAEEILRLLAASPSAPTAVQPCPDAARMAEHACSNAAQCWEPCGQLGKSEEHARAVSAEEEPEVYSALAALTAVQPAADDDLDCGHGPLEWADTGDALTPTERAACQQCGSDPHKMSCTIGGKDQLRLTAVATPTAVKEAGGVPAFILLAEQVLSMDMVTEKGVRARELARQALKEHDGYRTTLELVAHATAPGHDDGGYHEAAHDLATQARAAQPTTPVAPKTLEALTPDEVMQVLRKADCLGTVRLTTGTGPYDIDRTTVDTDVLTEYFTRALAAKNNMTLGGE